MAVDLLRRISCIHRHYFHIFYWNLFFLSIFNTNARAPGIDEALKRDILVMFQELIGKTLNTVIQPVQEAWAALTNYLQLLIQNWKIIILMGIILSVLLLCILNMMISCLPLTKHGDVPSMLSFMISFHLSCKLYDYYMQL